MNSLFIFYFKLIRKLCAYRSRFVLKNKIRSYYYLSRKRFKIDAQLKAGKGFSIESDLTESMIDIRQKLTVRDNFHIRMGQDGQLIIGENCFFNNNCSITCLHDIEIGHNNQFGENVLIYDHNHQFANKEELISKQGYSTGKITVGNNCWIGSNVVILKNVIIGDNVVIGAGCVIYKSVSSNTVVVNQQDLLFKSL